MEVGYSKTRYNRHVLVALSATFSLTNVHDRFITSSSSSSSGSEDA